MRTSSRRTTVSDIVEQLRLLVSTGELVGGEPLRQEELAAHFGVSRTPLREAIARLEVDGLFVTMPRRSTVVFKPSVAELLEIYEIRLLLEPRLAWSAAARSDRNDRLRLQSIADELAGADPWQAARLDLEFDAALWELASKPRMARIAHTLRDQSDPFARVLVGSRGREQAQDYQRQIMAAILARDGDSAGGCVLARLQATVLSLTGSPAAGSAEAKREESA